MKDLSPFSPAVVLLFGLLASACINLPGNPFSPDFDNTLYDDASIKTDIVSALLKKDPARANGISVYCFNGHVFLVGEADEDFRATSRAVAQATKGVVHITPHWFPVGTASTQADAEIETAIDVDRLFGSKEHTPHVGVDVWGGHVVLTGLAQTQAELSGAIAHVRAIPGVKTVTSYLSLP